MSQPVVAAPLLHSCVGSLRFGLSTFMSSSGGSLVAELLMSQPATAPPICAHAGSLKLGLIGLSCSPGGGLVAGGCLVAELSLSQPAAAPLLPSHAEALQLGLGELLCASGGRLVDQLVAVLWMSERAAALLLLGWSWMPKKRCFILLRLHFFVLTLIHYSWG